MKPLLYLITVILVAGCTNLPRHNETHEEIAALDVVVLEASDQLNPTPDGSGKGPILKLATSDDFKASVKAELNSPFGLLIRQLDALSRQYQDTANTCPQLNNKTLLFLSSEDGGFARKGFWFQQDGRDLVYCDLLYVDMTVSAKDISNGRFLEIFAHEMGHVFMRRIKGEVPPSPSSRFHNVFAITDYQTAFDEGFGIYFQTLAAVFFDSTGFRARIEGRASPTGAEQWLSNIDGRERISGVMHNKHAFDKELPPNLDPLTSYHHEGIRASYGNKLKNAQAMLSSEGVIATLFYRLATAPDLSALEPSDDNWRAKAISHHKMLFELLDESDWQKDESPYIKLLEGLKTTNPDYAKNAIKSFLHTTYATTVDKTTTAKFQALLNAGHQGDIKRFIEQYSVVPKSIELLTEKIINNQLSLTQELGIPIWLLQPDVTFPHAPWGGVEVPLTVNLNMASKAELTLLNIFSDSEIDKILSDREINGPFEHLKSIKDRIELNSDRLLDIKKLNTLHEQYQGAARE